MGTPLGSGRHAKHGHQPQKHLVLYPPAQDLKKNVTVDAVKELAHVYMQEPGTAIGMLHNVLQPVCRHVRAFANTAGKGVVNKPAVADRQNHGIDRVLHHQIVKGRRFNQAFFAAIFGFEANARGWPVGAIPQRLLQPVDVAPQAARESIVVLITALIL
jgi:hypothetical protein